MWWNKYFILILLLAGTNSLYAQCFSSANPVGGSTNLLVLEKNTLRVISFYHFNYGNQFYEGGKSSDYNMVESANYNFLGSIIGYGISEKLTLETELGYFINKTQKYSSLDYTQKGFGFSNAVVSGKFNVYKDVVKRQFISSSVGIKIPFTTKLQSVDGIQLPIELQPTIGAYGLVLQGFMVKENSEKGMRYFLTERVEVNFENKDEYKLGNAFFTSFFISRHLHREWLNGDWTTILQVRNETRTQDLISGNKRGSTGSTLFYLSPQINYVFNDLWNISAIVDLPVFQHFEGIQMSTKCGFSLTLSRDFKL